jgi:hypothetical protein
MIERSRMTLGPAAIDRDGSPFGGTMKLFSRMPRSEGSK